MNAVISNPALWDIDNPQLHKAAITLSRDGKTVDRYETTFGIRTIAFSTEKGSYSTEEMFC